MFVCVIASSIAVGSNFQLRRHSTVSLPTKFNTPLRSSKLLPLANHEKDLVCGFRAIDPHIVCSALVQQTEIKNTIAVQSGFHPIILNSDSSNPSDVSISSSTRGKWTKARTFERGKNPAKLSSDASRYKTTIEERPVIQYPLATESAIKSIIDHNTLVFMVDEFCSKNTIKDFVMTVFKVKAQKVNTLVMPDGTKKAYIKLAPEYNALDVAKEIKIM